MLLSVVVLLLTLSCSAPVLGGANDITAASYRLERRLGSDGEEWKEITRFSLSKTSPLFPPRLHVLRDSHTTLSAAEKTKFGNSTGLVYYRVVPEESASSSTSYPVAVTSTCAVIRGFTAVSKTTLLLREVLSVVPDEHLGVVGLQLHSETNNFHASMQNGDECDPGVVTSLFPNVEIEAELSVVAPSSVKPIVYSELKRLMEGENHPARRKGAEKKRMGGAAEDEDDDEGPGKPAQEPSFFQKYWYLFAIPFVISLLRGPGPQQQQAAPQQ